MAGQLIDERYRLEQKLGSGGMAEVWRAHDTELGRAVALKILSASADEDRFEREARAVATLSHTNICQLYDCGTVEGRPYMVLEYLPQGTLEQRLGSRPLPDEETRRIAAGLAAGLAHAHDRGIVHRDLKPANVLFDREDRPKIADFGIAGMAGALTLTDEGTVLGTAAYISPEQATGRPATPASDVYSFGVILYRMLTGRLPFEAAGPLALAQEHVRTPPPAIENVRPNAPHDLAQLAAAALAKDPNTRPVDGAALVTATGAPQLIGASAQVDDAPTLVNRSPLQSRRSRLLVRGAAGAVLAAAGIGVALVTSGGTAPASDTSPRGHSGTGPHAQPGRVTSPSAARPAPATTASPSQKSTTTKPTAAIPTPTDPTTPITTIETTEPTTTDTSATDTTPTDTTPTETTPTETTPTETTSTETTPTTTTTP